MGAVHFGMDFQMLDELGVRAGVIMTDGFTDSIITVGGGIDIAGLGVDVAYIYGESLGNSLIISAEVSLGALLGGEEPVEDVE